MKKIVENLLVIARSDDNTHNDKFSKIDLSTLVEKISSKLQQIALAKNVSSNCNIEQNLYVKGNPYFLEHAISNVIQNAIEYTKQGNVLIELSKDKKEAIVKIIDTGIGIDKKDLPHILKRFYRADSAKNIKSGAGLGLAITNQIIKDHYGKIEVESELGKGTIFIIKLPIH